MKFRNRNLSEITAEPANTMINKLGVPGILEFDRDAGTLRFYADPRYCRRDWLETVVITGLPAPLPDPATMTLRIKHMEGQNWEAKPNQISAANKSVPNQAVPTSITQPVGNDLPQRYVQPGCYSDILYPAGILQIMSLVLAGKWSGPNPEDAIDMAIGHWLEQNPSSAADYSAKLAEAIKVRGCLDMVLARLCAEVMTPPDTGDTIIIMRQRTRLLPGELSGALGGEYDYQLPSVPDIDISNDDPYALSAAITDFYAVEQQIQLRPPRPCLSQEVKDKVRAHLERAGVVLPNNIGDAYKHLEELLHGRDVEQSVLARLAYLAIFQALRTVNGDSAIANIIQVNIGHFNDSHDGQKQLLALPLN